MITSGAGWPAGGPGSSAGTSASGVGRPGDRPEGRGDAVRPVLPTDALNPRGGGRANAWRQDAGHQQSGHQDAGHQHVGHQHAGRQEAGRVEGSADAPDERTAPGTEPPAPATGSSRALVPVGSAHPPLSGYGGRASVHVPVASAPQLTVALSAPAKLMLHAAGGGDPSARTGGATGGVESRESPIRIPRGTATVASDSYRRHGGLPPLGIENGRIFRVSI